LGFGGVGMGLNVALLSGSSRFCRIFLLLLFSFIGALLDVLNVIKGLEIKIIK